MEELVAVVLVVCMFVISHYISAVLNHSLDKKIEVEFYSFEVVNEYDHDPNAFTQGLVYFGNNTLYESTGLYNQSSVRKVDLETGKVEILHKLNGSFFGEGLTLIGDRLFQLTWKTKIGFIYDKNSLDQIGVFENEMKEGWGFATDGKVIFGSDGTSSLYEISPQNFKVMKRVTVKYREQEIFSLNELEYINGEVWSNVFKSDCIARISHEDGKVLSWILLGELRKRLYSSGFTNINVVNGIAWDADNKRVFVTGKWWPKIYEIKIHQFKDEIGTTNPFDLCRHH
ncbi:Glutaminyl-peptide cyclotransferase [Zostera marina]|uniref:Glutaminyl-peptide cyclotransferase n=1 Tax=Zostera marina TaxID=29655 RepID=A0A0K9P1X0_ZOSMR|nr:Glutaminyl-peptide cyclotransferase [Zostera marina]